MNRQQFPPGQGESSSNPNFRSSERSGASSPTPQTAERDGEKGETHGWVSCRVGGFELESDWRIEPGEVYVLFGPSGAGKTTLLRAIAGLLRPRHGHIEIAGSVVYDGAGGQWVPAHRRCVGFLTQEYNLFPHLTVARNIAYGLRGYSKASVQARVGELISVLQLDGLERRRPSELSGGQQQRVALARALAPEPKLLLLDEPFASLDMELRRILRRELRSMLSRSPIPVLLVTHDREEALALGDSVQIIDEGRPIARGEPLDILGQPGLGKVARLVGVENLFRLNVESRNPRDGTMVCVGGGLRIEVPLDEATQPHEPGSGDGDSVAVAIRASDIILAHQELQGSSARNRLHGLVISVESHPPGYEVTLDCGQPLRCHITGGALHEMQVRPGVRLWAVFKASSCFLVQDPPAIGQHPPVEDIE